MSADAKMAEISRDPSAVISVIRHTVEARSESRYEAWLKQVTAITTVLHFDTIEHLKGTYVVAVAHGRLWQILL